MIDKEKILGQNNANGQFDRYDFKMEELYDAMEEYATLVMEDFMLWLEINFLNAEDVLVLPRLSYRDIVKQYLNQKINNKTIQP
jgi:elongation factor P--beta-lysine ligase